MSDSNRRRALIFNDESASQVTQFYSLFFQYGQENAEEVT